MACGTDERARDLTRIFHITSHDAWTTARANGAYAADSLATEGFIHCSDAHQVVWVANQRFRGRQDLVLLHIDPLHLGCEVRYENLEGGQQLFPHVYGAIPVTAVVDVAVFRPTVDGSFRSYPAVELCVTGEPGGSLRRPADSRVMTGHQARLRDTRRG